MDIGINTDLRDSYNKELFNGDRIIISEGKLNEGLNGFIFFEKGSFKVQWEDGDTDYLEDVHRDIDRNMRKL